MVICSLGVIRKRGRAEKCMRPFSASTRGQLMNRKIEPSSVTEHMKSHRVRLRCDADCALLSRVAPRYCSDVNPTRLPAPSSSMSSVSGSGCYGPDFNRGAPDIVITHRTSSHAHSANQDGQNQRREPILGQRPAARVDMGVSESRGHRPYCCWSTAKMSRTVRGPRPRSRG